MLYPKILYNEKRNKRFEVIGYEPNRKACINYDSCLLIVAYVVFQAE
jgi:hypothetical protein